MRSSRFSRSELEAFCAAIFEKLGIPKDEASDSAQILVAADARGIASHGVARMWRYKNGIELGIMKGGITPEVVYSSPLSQTLDGKGAMGLSLSKKAMAQVIETAKLHGVGFCSVKNSNHFGIAGFYSEMAARSDMIGIAMTNTAALGVPTFGREAMFGTNPIAVAAPATGGRMFSLDMATTVVTRGKIEMYEREGKPLPAGWAVDTEGKGTANAAKLLDNMLFQRGGGLMPLGGEGEEFSGFKGYGLAVLVDIMTAVASGGLFGKLVVDSAATSASVCHFFGALRLDVFRNPDEFKQDMAQLLAELESTPPAKGCERVYYAGQKEHESEALCEKIGVPLTQKVAGQLKEMGESLGVTMPVAL